jgi:hypothetical protein
MMKTFSLLALVGIASVALSQPVDAALPTSTTLTGSKSGALKAPSSPTPGPVAKSQSGSHKAVPTPTPAPTLLKLTLPKPTGTRP